jgi:predicted dehydrogenase
MSTSKLGVGIAGCGNIAPRYAENIATYHETELVGFTDIDLSKAEALAAQHGGTIYPSLETMLEDDHIQLVVNLTTHHAHKEVVTKCLQAGKHVHSEKPLALSYDDAKELVELAQAKGLRLGCSPFTLMGEAQQTAWKVIRQGHLGTVRLVYAEVNWGRIESWHPAPKPFYDVGVLFDVGVYPLSILTAIFGPARRVTAHGTVLYPDRVTDHGVPFRVETPDFVVSMIELADGTLVRLTTNFYVNFFNKQVGLELHGDLGSLHLPSWQNFDEPVEFAEFGKPYQRVPFIHLPYKGVEWGRGVRDLAQAIAEGRPHRATGEQAAHVVEILCAATESMETGQPVEVHSTFTPPAPMEWGQ